MLSMRFAYLNISCLPLSTFPCGYASIVRCSASVLLFSNHLFSKHVLVAVVVVTAVAVAIVVIALLLCLLWSVPGIKLFFATINRKESSVNNRNNNKRSWLLGGVGIRK